MATLLLCISLLSGCATTLTHPETGAKIRCDTSSRTTVVDGHSKRGDYVGLRGGDAPDSYFSIFPWWLLIPPLGHLYTLGGGFYRHCIDDAQGHGFVRENDH